MGSISALSLNSYMFLDQLFDIPVPQFYHLLDENAGTYKH